MKKIIITAVMLIGTCISLNAQSIAAKAGFTSGTVKVDNGFFDGSNSESGFHVGLVASFELVENIELQPEVLYTSVDGSSFLQIPILGKYEINDTGLSAQLGPQINFNLEDTGEDFNALSVGLTLGAGYDITDKFFVEAHYALQLTNSLKDGTLQDGVDGEFFEVNDASIKTNFLNIGVGYRFM